MKTTELIGPALDWAVALALGANTVRHPSQGNMLPHLHWPSPLFGDQPRWSLFAPRYSTDWAHGGQIIERECLALECIGHCWEAYTMIEVADEDFIVPQSVSQTGSTPLIAAMRCYVASKLGDEVEIPDDLL